MQLMMLLSIASARTNIRTESAYFVPDASLRAHKYLVEAQKRGVIIEIILPGDHIDQEFVRAASAAGWGDMLKARIQIYEYQPTMFHCKQMIVDDAWVSIGSANLDNRSFRINDEANLNVLDADFAAGQIKVFEMDKEPCPKSLRSRNGTIARSAALGMDGKPSRPGAVIHRYRWGI